MPSNSEYHASFKILRTELERRYAASGFPEPDGQSRTGMPAELATRLQSISNVIFQFGVERDLQDEAALDELSKFVAYLLADLNYPEVASGPILSALLAVRDSKPLVDVWH